MGIYDREYIREDEGSPWSNRSAVVMLIVANVVVFLVDLLFAEGRSGWLKQWLVLPGDYLYQPWEVWRLITYGFVHADLRHIFFNMYALWLFGTEMESKYGKAEFVRFYFAALLAAGLVWLLLEMAMHGAGPAPGLLLGASGAVTGVLILYVLNDPQRTILFFGIVPMKVWVLGAIYIAIDIFGALDRSSNVAHVAHLAGAAFGFWYVRGRLNLGQFVPTQLLKSLKRRRTKLKIHDPETKRPDLSKQVDAILEKISREGEASLTRQERKTLEEASRHYQRRRE